MAAAPNQPKKKFYCSFEEGSDQIHGPFDLYEMAGMLKGNHITGDSLTFIEGEEQWRPFRERPEFHLANEIPASAIAMHLKEEAESTESVFSPRRLMMLVWTMPVLFLIIGLRIGLKVWKGEEHAAAQQAQAEVSATDDSSTNAAADPSATAPDSAAKPADMTTSTGDTSAAPADASARAC